VFLPGEREIREAADHLRKHLSHQPVLRHAEVLPLFARLSARPSRTVSSIAHGGRRIVLATNVAETSLTVPGIRFVIDAGTARVKRYSFRSKVEQLLVEPISQSSANQRAGRCGRVANGICIRLYDEQGLRPARAVHRPGDPAQLAGRRHPAHEVAAPGRWWRTSRSSRPQARAIADGYQLLAELGAVDDANELTPIGQSSPACRWTRAWAA
jgi:ATP-dependent helicase HrpA